MISLTEEEVRYMMEDNMGICLACEAEAECVEPDAREYECENCGEHKVYGIEELILMGKIDIIEG